MRQSVTTWGGFIRLVLAALLATVVVDVPAVAKTYLGHILLFVLVVFALRSLIEAIKPSARRLLTRHTTPEA